MVFGLVLYTKYDCVLSKLITLYEMLYSEVKVQFLDSKLKELKRNI